MARPKLTEEQRAAATASARRLFIEANPGSGKTTIAAERFGVLRFGRNQGAQRSVTAISFTRSATAELTRRVRGRWGSGALAWPHGVSTVDALVSVIVHHLVRTGRIRWPGGHTTLEVLDDWRGHSGYRWLVPGNNYERVATLDTAGNVTSTGRRVVQPGLGFGNKAAFLAHLKRGRCAHQDLRDVLSTALRREDLRSAVSELLAASINHLVVDEVFDANRLDLAIAALCCDADIAVTLVGDPWQALYGFRGAKPDLVPSVIRSWAFDSLPLSRSFRFRTGVMKELAEALRASEAVSISTMGEHDIVLASKWETLWSGPSHVLPLSFGRTSNQSDAAVILLLDFLVRSYFSERAIFLPEALILLGLDIDTYMTGAPECLAPVVQTIASGASDSPERALEQLRQAVRDLGAPRRPRVGAGEAEQRQIVRLGSLAARLRATEPLVPGMTIHQAKGREWDHVGVILTASERARLGAGLDRDVESDRALYVALTRARDSVTSFAA